MNTPSPPVSPPDRAQVLAALNDVVDPRSGAGLVAAGLVQGLMVGEGRAGFMLEVAAGGCRALRAGARRRRGGAEGVRRGSSGRRWC